MKRFAAILAALALVPALSGGAQASSDNVSAMFDYHISDAFIQSLGEPAQTGAEATATVGGDHVRVVGSGTFNAAAGNATGGGTFVHTNASDTIVGFGTWTATSLVGSSPETSRWFRTAGVTASRTSQALPHGGSMSSFTSR